MARAAANRSPNRAASLVQHRLRAGFGLGEIAERTQISIRFLLLRAIERGEFEQLPADWFRALGLFKFQTR